MRRSDPHGVSPLVAAAVASMLLADPLSAQPRPDRPPPRVETGAATEDAIPDDWDVPPDTPATVDGGATLNPLLLQPVRDDTLGLEYQDRPAYFYALWLARQIDPQLLARHAADFRAARRAADPKYATRKPAEFPVFVDLFQHPQQYRGRPVTLHGYFRKLVEYDPGPNDLEIGKVYEGWIYTQDSQQNPAVVVFTKKPEGLPLGGDITEEVQLTGYFLKMYGYEARDTTRKAPLILAGEVRWMPARAANVRPPVPVGVYVALSGLAGLAVWGLWRTSRRRAAPLSRFNTPGRNFDEFPPQEFLGTDGPPVEPHH
uniref:Uncharacterized protein n=1 Tax=Schlesneria paludicola TaxID=360056 RepID=A0A7C2NYT2_9PLAN